MWPTSNNRRTSSLPVTNCAENNTVCTDNTDSRRPSASKANERIEVTSAPEFRRKSVTESLGRHPGTGSATSPSPVESAIQRLDLSMDTIPTASLTTTHPESDIELYSQVNTQNHLSGLNTTPDSITRFLSTVHEGPWTPTAIAARRLSRTRLNISSELPDLDLDFPMPTETPARQGDSEPAHHSAFVNLDRIVVHGWHGGEGQGQGMQPTVTRPRYSMSYDLMGLKNPHDLSRWVEQGLF